MTQSPKQDAFQFLMGSRDKVIGRNSPGKEIPEQEDVEMKQSKRKLSARKSFLEGWSEKKGASKRKREDKAKAEYIDHKLQERATRLKDMLNVNNATNGESDFEDEEDIGVVKKTKCRIVESDSENSKDSIERKNEKDVQKDKSKENRKSKKKTRKSSNKWTCKIKIDLDDKCEETIDEKLNGNGEHEEECSELEISEEAPIKNAVNEEKQMAIETIDKPTCEDVEMPKIEPPEVVENPEESTKRCLRPRRSKVCYSNKSDDECEEVKSKKKKSDKSSTKDVRLAPIFIKNPPKPKLDPEQVEARRAFLFSGVPDQLKAERIKTASIEEPDFDVFPKISHVQQLSSITNWIQPQIQLQFAPKLDFDLDPIEITSKFDLTHTTIDSVKTRAANQKSDNFDLKSLIRQLKETHPDYPVFKTFKSIRSRHPNLEKKSKTNDFNFETWPEKYKPRTCAELLGNQKNLTFLTNWLENFQTTTGKSSDVESDFDTDSNTSPCTNTVLLSGPHGCGKTSAIYAVCNDLELKVIEVNASSKRTGKWLLQELQEATQSHQVGDISNSPDKKCVLLIEDVDIVFDQDEGFASALTQIIATSKRPIILTTNHEKSFNLQKFLSQCKVLHFAPVPALHAIYLQIVCLTEGFFLSTECLETILDRNKGDLRKTLLFLQFCNKDSEIFGRPDSVMSDQGSEKQLKHLASICDYYSANALLNPGCSSSKKSYKPLRDSVELEECFTSYRDVGFISDFTHTLLSKVTSRYKKSVYSKIDIELPERRKSKIWNYENKLEPLLPRLTALDPTCLALDYMPTLRAIARLEDERQATNGKRRNRFYHYLNCLGVDCGDAKLKMYCELFRT